jgi:hypothetical protein
LPPAELKLWLEALPMPIVARQEAVELGFRCHAAGLRDAARVLARRRLEAGMTDVDSRDLMLSCWSRTEPCWCGSSTSFKRCHGRLQDESGAPERNR